jgi:hypothetical protein
MNIILAILTILGYIILILLAVFSFLICLTGINNDVIYGKETTLKEDVMETIDILRGKVLPPINRF